MSTAHRPTWVAALGGSGLRDGITSAPTHQKSAKDMPAHTKLKYRQIGQDAPEELLARKQQQHQEQEDGPALIEEAREENEDVDSDLDADTDIEETHEAESEQESEDEDDDGDETAELLRELEKIKREREEQRAREAAKREKEILSKNPLINLGQESEGFAVKRRWDDDVIFKNQAKGLEEKPKKRFINDTTRSDFHRKFLNKYIV